MDNLKVHRVREGDFKPKILPEKRKVSIDLGEVIFGLFASGSSVRDVTKFADIK
ncbi:transposase [Thermodesulfobacterium hveragerdense]|uniref:transposase n=1 Tax=Thermodesulfobacterium hveragerdense TaxID=53424 RepID=UPI00040C302D